MRLLKDVIQKHYPIEVTKITLLRKMIGSIYKVDTLSKSYIFKVYTKAQEPLLKRTLFTMTALKESNICIPNIYQSTTQHNYTYFHDDQDYIGILFQYIEGSPPSKTQDIQQIATLLHSLHAHMDKMKPDMKYTLGKPFYVDRFIDLLKEKRYPQDKIFELQTIAHDLFSIFHHQPQSFCHGDFHNENMIVTLNQKIYLIDFDASNYTNNLIDIATIADQTNFNQFQQKDFHDTIAYIKTFLLYYIHQSKHTVRPKDVLSFIPLRHMELIATIAEANGIEDISTSFLDQQYHWIKDYYETLKTSHL